MHQVSLETICPLKAFQLHYCPDNDAKSMVKHFIFLHKFAVIKVMVIQPPDPLPKGKGKKEDAGIWRMNPPHQIEC